MEVIGNDQTCSSPGYSWTKWFDLDNPSGDGDDETRYSYFNEGYNICYSPIALEVLVTNIKKYAVRFLMFLRRKSQKRFQKCLRLRQAFVFFLFNYILNTLLLTFTIFALKE